MKTQLDQHPDYPKSPSDASHMRELAVDVGETLLEEAREVGHRIEDRVQRALARGRPETPCRGH